MGCSDSVQLQSSVCLTLPMCSSCCLKEQTTCPLCIEELDSTDLQFLPCPCGWVAACRVPLCRSSSLSNPAQTQPMCFDCRYRVCLFCYGKIKEMCHSLCPGCRREYGEAQHLPDSQESSTTAAVTVRATQAQNGQVHAMGLAAAQAGAPRLPPRVIAPPAPPPPRRPDAAAGKRPEEPGTSFRGDWEIQWLRVCVPMMPVSMVPHGWLRSGGRISLFTLSVIARGVSN